MSKAEQLKDLVNGFMGNLLSKIDILNTDLVGFEVPHKDMEIDGTYWDWKLRHYLEYRGLTVDIYNDKTNYYYIRSI